LVLAVGPETYLLILVAIPHSPIFPTGAGTQLLKLEPNAVYVFKIPREPRQAISPHPQLYVQHKYTTSRQVRV
jgi:hypothetical protein